MLVSSKLLPGKPALQTWLAYAAVGLCLCQTLISQEEEGATEAKKSETSEAAAADKSEENAVSNEQAADEDASRQAKRAREEMLERLADQLSRRMRTLRDREAALSAREKSLVDRESTASQREKELSDMEELMRVREEVIKRREKLPPPQSWYGPEAPNTFGQYAAVLDGQTMQFYHKKSAEVRTPVASTQKIVTALVVCQDGDLDQMVEITPEVARVEPTVIGLQPGETYSRRQLVTALLVRSGNDTAAALAIDNAGSIQAFAEKMNVYARYIGMTDSHFVNPHGLPAEGQYSTARDIAIAAYEAYQLPEIRKMISMKSYDFTFNDGRVLTLYNTNRILGTFEGCNGMKTGFTYAAGNCLVSSASVGGRDRISVIIKSARPYVWEDSAKLLDWSLNLDFGRPPASSEHQTVLIP